MEARAFVERDSGAIRSDTTGLGGGLRSRITRVYVYKWFGEPPGARLDAGLVDPGGRPRQAYWVVRRFARSR